MAMKEELNILIQAQYPLIYLVTGGGLGKQYRQSLRPSVVYLFGRLHTELLNTQPGMLHSTTVSPSGDRVDNPAARPSFLSLRICTHL